MKSSPETINKTKEGFKARLKTGIQSDIMLYCSLFNSTPEELIKDI